MPDVLILAKHDWANTGWRFFKCLQIIGLDVIALKGEYHPFMYPEQIPIHPVLTGLPDHEYHLKVPGLKQLALHSKVLHFIASVFIDTDAGNKPIVMQHGGRAYRANSDILNSIYNEFVDVSIIQCPDLLDIGAVNQQWIYYPVDIDFIQPVFKPLKKNKLTIGHFPSLPKEKGTEEIVKVIAKLEEDPKYNKRFQYIGARGLDFRQRGIMIWSENLKRISQCDIIIETMSKTAQGKTYGEWGNTAIESAALGKIVITNSLTQDLYKKEFGDCALNIANEPEDLESTLKQLLSFSDDEIYRKKKETRAWVEDKHSMRATANRLWERVYSKLL